MDQLHSTDDPLAPPSLYTLPPSMIETSTLPLPAGGRRPGSMTRLLAFVFILSGAAGLIYESIWSRYLSLFVGHSAYAQIIVLVIFLGGMSIGAFLIGKRSAGLRRPLAWYALAELLCAALGWVFHDVYGWVTAHAYLAWFPALAGGPALVMVKWAVAGLLILPQSILLGTTFPLMSAGVMRLREGRSGHVLGLLYFANSIGAAVGVLVAGFALIQWVGLPGTLYTAAMLNLIAGAIVWVSLRFGFIHEGAAIAEEAEVSGAEPTGGLWRVMLGVAFGTALSSFIYEIGWIRMLSLSLGSATHSFELMLSAFILGIALGAYWIRRQADRFADPVWTLGVVQWAMGVLAVATIPMYLGTFEMTAGLLKVLTRTGVGYAWFGVARYGLCLIVMLPATFCAGMTLPLITKTLIRSGSGERAIGAVYGINTLGSIVGAALAGLLLMPLLGLKALLVLGALIDIGIGAALMLMRRPVRHWSGGPQAAALGTLVLIAGIIGIADFSPTLLTSGVYRHGAIPKGNKLVFDYYKDGRTATVSVRHDSSDTNYIQTLATNGKPDASVMRNWGITPSDTTIRQPLTADMATQVLLPMITLAHAPNARVGAVIGFGSGVTSHLLLASPHLERLYTVEIEPEMIRASRVFRRVNYRAYDDPRSTFVIDDAKSFFAASGKRFDLIMSEPSNPWVSGVSGLFTEEFYQRVSRQLSDSGVFGQWLHLYEISDSLVVGVLGALDKVFPAYEVFFTSQSDILIVATNQPRLRTPDWSVANLPMLRQDLHYVRPITPEVLESTRLAGREVLHPYLRVEDQVNSDFFPELDLGGERSRFMRAAALGMMSLGEGRLDLGDAIAGRRQAPGSLMVSTVPVIERNSAAALAATLRALWQGQPVSRDTLFQGVRDVVYRMRRFQRSLAGSAPPSDWHLWTKEMALIEGDLFAGTAGVSEPWFYDQVRAYMTRAHAPLEAYAALTFVQALAIWRWDDVTRSGNLLLRAARRGDEWLPVEMLREGTVLARVASHDARGAREAFQRSAGLGDDDRFRDRILGSIVLDLEGKIEPPIVVQATRTR